MPPALRNPKLMSYVSCAQQICTTAKSRSFSTTPHRDQRITRARRQMFQWLTNNGQAFYEPLNGSTNYLSAYDSFGELRRVAEGRRQQDEGQKDAAAKSGQGNQENSEKDKKEAIPPETIRDLMPFPQNNRFISQPVLSEELREEVWERVMRLGRSVRTVSAELGISMERVGAVVRLKEIEKEWERIGKPLARPYSRAVMNMLPKTPYHPDKPNTRHESINDLPVHAWTMNQMFYPTSESRIFTREDAAKAFNENLLPADARIPHPQMIEEFREVDQRLPVEEIQARKAAREEAENLRRREALAKEARREAAIQRVDQGRFEFRITPVNVDSAGKDGRGVNGVGIRYGAPNMDRKKGNVKIPTSVE